MAYRGEFKPFFQYIADCIYTFSSQRDRQKGEAFVHGFTLALTSQCRFYRPISELDNQNGYADVFLRPRCEIYKDMRRVTLFKVCRSVTYEQKLPINKPDVAFSNL